MKKQVKILIVSVIILILINTFSFVKAASNNTSNNGLIEITKVATKTTNTDSQEYKDKSNNELSALSVSGYELSPAFNKNTTEYYITIPSTVSSLDVTATPEKEKATAKISGNTKLTKTDNTITISVTSENKLIKTYKIYVTKQDDNGLKLSSLSIKGYELSPVFSENTYYYECKISKLSENNKLEISANANKTSAQVEIIGNNADFSEGKELITILVKDGELSTAYQIQVADTLQTTQTSKVMPDGFLGVALTVIEKVEDFFQDKIKRTAFIVSLVVIILLMIIRAIVKASKKNKKEE